MSLAALETRAAWHPALSEVFGIHPWMFGDLTVGEIQALAKYVKERNRQN